MCKIGESDDEVASYLEKVVCREAGDHSGLIYGIGHAVYTLSDPRATILKQKAYALAQGTEMEPKFRLFQRVEKLAPEVFYRTKGDAKIVSANVDFYSGLVYQMLGIPSDLFTPMFAVSRIAGWCAHRMEEMLTGGRIMRPAYRSVVAPAEYVPIDERDAD